MGRKRKSTGTRLRMEILKRDGFKCYYCGRTPAQNVIIEVDHVVPVSEGGTDDPENLVAACEECNAGKSNIPLDKSQLKPRNTIERQKEHLAQLKEYLALQKEVGATKNELADLVRNHWVQHIGPLSKEMHNRLELDVTRWPHEKLLEAIEITGRKLGAPDEEFNYRDAVNQQKYFSGILRKWKIRETGREPFEPPEPEPPPKPPEPKWSRRAQLTQTRLYEELARLRATNENNIDNAVMAFGLLAYGHPENLRTLAWDPERAVDIREFDPEYTGDPRIRGLVLRVETMKDGAMRLRVEDDPEWNLNAEMNEYFNIGLADLYHAIQDGDRPTIMEEFQNTYTYLRELSAFVHFHTQPDAKIEEALQLIRDSLNWPNLPTSPWPAPPKQPAKPPTLRGTEPPPA